MIDKFSYTLTVIAINLCTQWGIVQCDNYALENHWMNAGGMCGSWGCNWEEGCPNDQAANCEAANPANECFAIATYPTIGSLKKFDTDGTLDGPGGVSYLCHAKPKPCIGDDKECALMY